MSFHNILKRLRGISSNSQRGVSPDTRVIKARDLHELLVQFDSLCDDARVAYNEREDINKLITPCPLENIHDVLSFSSKDWSTASEDAWLWGIVCGWDDGVLAELQDKYGWPDSYVVNLKEFHRSYKKLRTITGSD